MSDERLARIQARLDVLVTGQEELHAGQARLEKRMDKLEIGREVLVDAVKQIAEGHEVTQALMKQGFADLRDSLSQRLQPLEATVRLQSAILRHHNLSLPTDAP